MPKHKLPTILDINLLESILEFPGNVSVVFWLFHDFADHPLLAVKIIIVKVLVHILEDLDPLEDVDSFPWGIVVGPIIIKEDVY